MTVSTAPLMMVSGLTLVQEVSGDLIQRKHPGAAGFGKATITRGADKSAAFTDWIKTSLDGHDGLRHDITIVALDARQQPVRRFHLTNVRATFADPSIETVTIAYTDITAE
ncbi:phage tail protein [Streptomyces sp. NPDC048361]|uniref:phage tail protein n=1 Tax=Streptomyces sp. NPDC048361 TaxID=3154720 RepID=UPI00342CAF76